MPCMNKPSLGGGWVGSMRDACMPVVVSADVVDVDAPRVRAYRESLGKGGHDVTRGLLKSRKNGRDEVEDKRDGDIHTYLKLYDPGEVVVHNLDGKDLGDDTWQNRVWRDRKMRNLRRKGHLGSLGGLTKVSG
jgi:hypothetical protein